MSGGPAPAQDPYREGTASATLVGALTNVTPGS